MMDEIQEKVTSAYQIANQGDFDHARMILEEALYDDSNNVEAWLLLADLAEDRDEALQCYQMVLEISPDNWISQQRLKLLLSSQSAPVPAETASTGDSLGMFDSDDSEDLMPDFDAFMGEDDEFSDGDGPTLKESFQAHRKLIIRAGIGLAAFVALLLVAWAGSVAFMAWRLGYLIIGG